MLFLKHIFRSIKKSPLQPIIILLTLILSVTTFLAATKIAINVIKETNHYKTEFDYVGDITIKPSKNDDVRFLFVEDAEEIIGNDGIVHGEFKLSALLRNGDSLELIDVSAVDFEQTDKFYQLKYYEYGEFTKENINNSIILSSDVSHRLGLGVGDEFTISLLNKQMTFTIQAIGVGDDFLNQVEGVISIGAVMDAIAEANPAVSSFATDTVPYTVLQIRLNDQSRVDEFIEKLGADERFEDKNIIKESTNTGSADFVSLTSIIMTFICTTILTVISIIVISTSLDLLSKKRIKDSALFMLSGAESSQLNKILYLECLIYSFISAMSGLLLSSYVYKKINAIFDWNVDDIRFELYDIPLVILVAPAIVLLTAFIHTKRAKRLSISERLADNAENKSPDFSPKPALIFLIVFTVLAITTFLIPVKYKYMFSLPAFASFLAFVFLFMPCFADWVSKLLIKIIERRKYASSKLLLALKNFTVSYPLKHATRIITLLVSLIATVFLCLGAIKGELNEIAGLFNCKYVSIGANERTDDMLEEVDSVDATYRFNFLNQLMSEQNTVVLGFSLSDNAIDYLHPSLKPKALPKGNEIVISSSIALLENKNVGDTISFKHESNVYTFTITEIMKSNTSIIYFDAKAFGISNDFLCINTDAQRNTEEYRDIANALETRGASIVDFEIILEPINKRLISYAELLTYVLMIALFTTVFGIINVLVSSFVARKQERAVYYTVGMSKSDIRKTGLIEILYLLFISLILTPLFTLLPFLVLDAGINSFGIDLFYI